MELEDGEGYSYEEGDEEIMGEKFKFVKKQRQLKQKKKEKAVELPSLCNNETILLMRARWDRLIASFYDVKKGKIDSSKIPDLYDAMKFDILHNFSFIRGTGGPVRFRFFL
jgi:hypothetical protein